MSEYVEIGFYSAFFQTRLLLYWQYVIVGGIFFLGGGNEEAKFALKFE